MIGRGVLKGKSKSAYDQMSYLADTLAMQRQDRASAFRKAFIERTRYARERARLTQEEMAAILGTTQGTYKQWETRNPMPIEAINAFCLATRVSEKWLLTGRETREAAE